MRASSVVESERAFLLSVLGAEGPLVVFIHGIGGVGKSALVEAFTAEARGARRGRPPPGLRHDRAHATRLPGGDLERDRRRPHDRRRCRGPPGASLGDRVVLVLDRYEVLRPIDLWLQQTFVPAPCRTTRASSSPAAKPRCSGWSMSMGRLFREPVAGQPAPRRCRGAAPTGGRRRRRPRADQPARPGPSAVAAPRRNGARRGPGTRPRGDDRDRDRRGADGAVPRPPRSADAAGAGRGLGRAATDALADGRDAAGRRAAGCVRAGPGPAVRRAEQRRARRPRHGPRGRGGLPARVRSRPVTALPDRRVAAAPRRGHPGDVARDVALHRRPAVHPRESGRPRGVLPDVRAPLLRRAGQRRRTGRRSARSRRRASRPSRWRSSRTGGAACPTRSGRPATEPGESPGSRRRPRSIESRAPLFDADPARPDLARRRPALARATRPAGPRASAVTWPTRTTRTRPSSSRR